MSAFDNIVPFHPLDFFQLKFELAPFHGKFLRAHKLPSLNGNEIGELSIGWSPQGLYLMFETKVSMSKPLFPDYTRGDVLELLVDCRDNKEGHSISRYCHHFICFAAPVEVEGKAAHGLEVTRFRGEDTHPLCSSEKIEVTIESKKRFKIYLPRDILVGYEPEQFRRLGFSYIVRTHTDHIQTLSASLEDFALEQYPSLWPTFHLV